MITDRSGQNPTSPHVPLLILFQTHWYMYHDTRNDRTKCMGCNRFKRLTQEEDLRPSNFQTQVEPGQPPTGMAQMSIDRDVAEQSYSTGVHARTTLAMSIGVCISSACSSMTPNGVSLRYKEMLIGGLDTEEHNHQSPHIIPK